MPLPDQPIEIPLVQGLDSKTDPKLVDNQRPISILNGTFDERGSLRKRPGCDILTNSKIDGVALSSGGQALFAHAGQLVELNSGSTDGVGQAYSLAETAGALVPRGDAFLLRVAKTPLLQNGAQRLEFSADFGGSAAYGLHAYTERDSAGTEQLLLSVLDRSTGNLTLNRSLLNAGTGYAFCPRVVGTTGVFYTDSGGLMFRPWSAGAPTTIGAAVVVVATATGMFDAAPCPVNGGSVIVYKLSGTGRWNVSRVSAAGVITATRDLFGFGGVTPNGDCATVVEFTDGRFGVAVTDTVAGLYFYSFNSPLTLSAGATVLDASATASTRIAMGRSSANQCCVATEQTAGVRVAIGSSNAAVVTAGALWGPSLLGVQMGLIGAPFYGADSLPVVPSLLISAVQPTYYLLRGPYSPHGRLMAGRAFISTQTRSLRIPQARADTSLGYTRHELLAPEAGRGQDIGGANPVGFALLTVTALGNTSITENVNAVPLDGRTLFSGASPCAFDGSAFVEEGFHHYPEALTAVDAGAGALTQAGTFFYVSLYEWVDENGLLHRSAPSVPVSLTLAANRNATLTLATLRLTERTVANKRFEVRIAVFRTLSTGSTVYYRIGNGGAGGSLWVLNDPSTISVSFNDSSPDATISVNEAMILEEAGGALDRLPLPALSHATHHQARLFGVSAEDDEVAYTSQVGLPGTPGDGFAVASHTNYRLRVPSEGGALVAVASLDDKLILFRRSKRYVIFGEGPNLLGQGGTYSDGQAQTDDVGCIDAASVISTPAGIIFRSLKGYYLIDRSLGLQYIGAGVEAYDGTAVRRALLVPAQNHVRFVLTDGSVLVFNYEFSAWAVWTGGTYVDACVWDERVVLLRSSGAIYLEDALLETEPGSTYLFSFATAWLKTAGIAGFQRVRRVTLVGDGVALEGEGGTVSVSMAFRYDYDENAALADSVSGSLTIAAGAAYPTPLLLRHKPATQKCSAIKIHFSEVAGGTGVRLGFSAVRLDIAVKRGSAKLSAARTV